MLELPAWDCLPYDRVSPGADAAARRLDALAAIAALGKKPHRAVVLTTANALLQRMPPAEVIEAQTFRARPGNQVDMNALIARLENSGFERVPTVRDVGEFAVRGGILDLYRAGLGRGAAARLLRRHAGDDPRLRLADAAHHRPAQRRCRCRR